MAVGTTHKPWSVHRKLKIGILLTGLIFVVEVIGGLASNSLALLADAGHVLADVLAMALTWYGIRQMERPSSYLMTFGYHRVGVLVAIVNTISIFGIAFFVFFEAYHRWQDPPEVNSLLMSTVAVVGLAVNVLVAYWLHNEPRDNINVRSAFWHVMGDALASVAVIAGGILMAVTGLFIIDPILSVLIGFTIAFSAWKIFREGLKVLLEATPHQVDVNGMIEAMKGTEGVRDVHDVHAWSISPELHAMSAHVVIDDLLVSQGALIRQQIEEVLRERFHIDHSAIQMESAQCEASDVFCRLTPNGTKEEDHHGHSH